MAVRYQPSHETTNFARLSQVVVAVCGDLMRSVLRAKVPPPGLTGMLQSQQNHLSKILEYRYRQILYPAGGVFSGTLEDLDFTLLYKLVRNIQGINITPHQNGWGKTPDNADRTLSANIDRLRVERNEAYGHLPTASLSDTDFNFRWGIIRQSVIEIEKDALTGDKYEKAVEALLTVSMDPDTEKSYIEELEKQMAVRYQPSHETTNFARLSQVVVAVCGDLMRSVLRAKVPPPGLTGMLQSQQNHLSKILEYRYRQILYPAGGVFSGTLEDLDFTLLYKLVRNIQGINITPHQNGWGKTPDNADRTLSANIDRLRVERNEAYGHLSTTSLSDTDFNFRWGIIRQSVIEIEKDALTGDKYEKAVEALLTVSMDPDTEKSYIEELEKHYKADLEVKAIAMKNEGAVAGVATKQKSMALDIGVIKGAVAGVATEQKSMALDIGVIKGAVAGVATEQKSMALDIGVIKDKLNATAANTRHTKELHPDLKPMIERAKAKIIKEKEGKTFCATKAFRDAQDKLQKNRIVVIKGNTGDGKTATAIQLLHWLSEEQQGRHPLQLHKIKTLDKLAPKSQLITFIDDIFGEKDVGKNDVQEWNKRISDVKTLFVDEQTQANFLLITIRNEIFNALEKCSLGTVFTKDNIIDLSLDTFKIAKEKKELLELYKPKDSTFSWGDEEKDKIIKLSPNIGFPQCCQLFCNSVELQKKRVRFFEKPFQFLNEAMSKLRECCAILFLFLNEGIIRVKDIDPNSKQINKTLLEEAFEIDLVDGDDDRTSLTYKKKVEFVKKSLDKLLGFLIVKEKHEESDDEVYRFYHDSIYVAVALLYGEKTPIGYIQNCPSKSLSYLTTSKTSPNMIVISSDHYTDMCERLLREFVSEKNDYGTCIGSLDVWKDRVFVERFVRLLNDRKVDKLAVLNKACSSSAEECALYLLCEGVKPDKDTPLCVVEGGCVDVLREILQYDVTPTARNDNNNNVLYRACELGRVEMVTVLCDAHPHLVHDTGKLGLTPLHLVAQTGNCSMFDTVERTVLKSLCRVEDEQHKCETVDGRVVHRSCACAQYMSQLVDDDGSTVLHMSCLRGQRKMCKFVCERYPTLTTIVDKDGYHCLHYIAQCTSDVDMFTECETHVKQYVESTGREYDITTILTSHGSTVLHMSCLKGQRKMCKFVCERYPTLTTIVDKDGCHCLHYIAQCTSDVDMFTECETHVKQYVESTGREYDITTILTSNGQTVLHMSCVRGQRKMCKFVCERYPTLTTIVDKNGGHCLHYIARCTSDVDMFTECETHVKLYLESTGREYDITTILTSDGQTVLHRSCAGGQRKMCKFVCERYPTLTTIVDKDGGHCLHYIAQCTSDVDMFTECETHVKQYLESTGREYDITTILTSDGQTVLHMSCDGGQRKMCKFLCERYPTLTTIVDKDGCHCLHCIAQCTSDVDMFTECETHVKQYVESTGREYDITTILTSDGQTVLHMSCDGGQRKMCKFVCERYPTLTTIVDKDGYHCLHYIAGCTSDVDMFTECETHVKQYVESTGREYDITTILTSDGQTVLHMSCLKGQRKMCKFVCERYPTLTTIVDKNGGHCLHYIAQCTSDVDMFTECETHVKQYVESTGREYDITTILTSDGQTVLHRSCYGGQRKMCKFVCERYPTLTTIVDKDGCHCLHVIAQCTSDVDMFTECETHVKQYVESTGLEYDITTILTSNGQTVLHMSCVRGQRKMCKFVCERYPTLTTIVDKYGHHCLHYIAQCTSDVDMFTECETHVKQYVESTGREYDITTILTSDGQTVLHRSCVGGQRKMCKFVCERYPTLTTIVDKYGCHCLHYIAQCTSDVDMFTECETHVKQYVESTGREYDITTILTSDGQTVLHRSCYGGQRKMCKFVCERYPTLTTIVDKHGCHCLHYIAQCTSDVDMFTECETHVKQYVESTGREYDITTILTSDGQTVLHRSCVGGQRKMCKFVCERYPTLTTIVDKYGCHCLHYIAQCTSDVDMFTECETHVKQYVESTGREYDITTILTSDWQTVLHRSCYGGQRKMCKFVCERYPTLTTIVDKHGYHCLHYIAGCTSDVDMFTECETRVKQYVESTGREYDITTILTSDGQTVLHRSCVGGQRKMCKFVCERYPTLTTIVDKHGCHCLHYIARYTSDVDMFTECETHVKQYVESTGREYDITTILTSDGQTVLHRSCYGGQRKMCKFVCERYPTLTTIVDKYGWHCLHYIAQCTSDVDMFTECETHVKQYVESTGREYDITTILTSDGQTVLHRSCVGGQRKMCKFVCERYPTLTTIVDKDGYHCLHYIARCTSDVDMFTECETHVKQYVESTGREYDITTILTSLGATVLHMSCEWGQRKMCKFVCERYPTLTTIVDKYGGHCLHYIAQCTSDVDMFTECETHVKQYVESTGREYDITTILTSDGQTVLHRSCVGGQRKMCKFVCERYPTLTTIVDKYGCHCLHYIAQCTSDVDMFTECETHVKQYVESTGREYDITTILTSDGQTVLHRSCYGGQRKMCKFVCERYPTLTTIVDKDGCHCLHVIAQCTSDVDMFTECETHVKQYVESTGLEYDITTILTSNGQTVLHMSCVRGQRKMCKFVCERYPTLTTIVDKYGHHCLHYIAQCTSDVDMFTECETHVKQYVESTGREYDITTILTSDGQTVLHRSCVGGQRKMCKFVCERYPTLTTIVDKYGCHCLHYIAQCTSDVDMFTECETHVKQYVESTGREYDITTILTSDGQTVLHRSCVGGQRKMCKFVCERYPTLTTIVDKYGCHCLHYIAQCTSDVDMFTECETHVKQYVESTGREYDITTILTSDWQTVLHRSCYGGQRKMCKFVCERYPTLTTIVDKHGYHCLHYIAGCTSDVDMFTECETRVKQYVESTGREYDITTILTSDGSTVLHRSCVGGQRKMCKFVCERYPTLTTIVDKHGCHCLHYIARYTSDVDMFTECETHVKQYLESTGREYDITTILTSHGATVLHMSCVKGQRKMCKFVCERYPTLTTIVDKYGRHCLHVIAGYTSDVDMFTECETHVKQYVESTGREYDITTILTSGGETVLHMSCVEGQRKMCKFVCERYPTLTTIVDKYGHHCLHVIARDTSDVDMFTECETHVKQYVESTGREYDITTILTSLGATVLHMSCFRGQRKMCKFVCERYPTLTTIVNKDGRHCLHYIARYTSDVDMFTECETHVKQYVESTGREYDITTILTIRGNSVLNFAKDKGTENNPLYDHLVKVFGSK